MTVKAILDRKGREVFTSLKDMTVSEAAHILAEKRIGAIVIVDGKDQVLGILSERDVVRAVAAKGPDALSRPIAEFMTSKVVRCKESHSVNEVMTIMTNGRFRHLPVDAEGSLGGIVSIGDVVRMRIEQVEREAEDMKAYIAG